MDKQLQKHGTAKKYKKHQTNQTPPHRIDVGDVAKARRSSACDVADLWSTSTRNVQGMFKLLNSYQFIWAIGDAEIDVDITGHRSSLCGFQEWSPEDLLRDLSSLPSLPSAEGRRTNSSVQAAKCLQFLRFGSPEPKELDKPSFFKCILILTDSMCIQCDFGYIWVNYNIL